METDMKPKCLLERAVAAALIACAAAAVLCTADCAAGTGAEKTGWGTVRVQGIVTMPLGDNSVEVWNDCGDEWADYLNFSGSIDVGTAAGILAGFEYVFAGKYGLETNLVYWRKLVELNFATTGLTVEGSPNFIMPTVGFNYHFLVDEKKDMYVGGLCCLGVYAVGFYTDIEVSKDLALGLNLGMDYYVRGSWSMGASLKYIDFGEMDFSLLPPYLSGIVCDNGLFGIGSMNSISLAVGAGYRF